MAQNEKNLILSHRAPMGSFDLYDNVSAPEFFVDGVAQLHMSPAVTKVRFFKVVNSNDDNGIAVEQRDVNLILIIPTQSLLDWVSNIGNNLKESVELLQQGSDATISNLRKMVK